MSSMLAGPFGGGFPSGNMQMITTFVDFVVSVVCMCVCSCVRVVRTRHMYT